MTDMHVMNALMAKRGELIGQIEDRRWELKHRGEELAHLEVRIQFVGPAVGP